MALLEKLEEVIAMETVPAKQVRKRGEAERSAAHREATLNTLNENCAPQATQSILDNINSLPLVLYKQSHR